MNYGELKTTVLSFAHRPDLSDEVARFVQLAEGMIARELRSAEQVSITTLDDDDRIEDGRYQLPSDFLEDRVFYAQWPLEKVSLAELKSFPNTARPSVYAVRGTVIEFRGVPVAGAEIEMEYFARPAALTDDEDTTAVLTAHPTLYIEGALFHLYKFTQDIELAQGALDTFGNAVETLNEQAGRQLGGGRVKGGYNLGNFMPRGGY